MRMVRGFYNEQNNTVNVVHYDTNHIISLDCGKWEQGLRTTPNSQGKMDALAIEDPVEYVRAGRSRCIRGQATERLPRLCLGYPQTNKGTLL